MHRRYEKQALWRITTICFSKFFENIFSSRSTCRRTTENSTILADSINKIRNIDVLKNELTASVKKAKSKILDLAIRGKLIPQDPNDEPASVLLERIRVEKEELIKQGKIKRDKKESIIFRGDDNSYYRYKNGKAVCIDDDLPYEVPNGWIWAILPEVVYFRKVQVF